MHIVERVVTDQNFGFCAVVEHYQIARGDHQIVVGVQQIDQLQRQVDFGIFRHIEKVAVLRKQFVECGESVVGVGDFFAKIATNNVGVALAGFGQRAEERAVWQCAVEMQLVVEHKRRVRLYARHFALEQAIFVDSGWQLIDIQSIIAV